MTADSPTLPSSSAPQAGAAARAAPAWKVWTGLWIVYIVWGSTYLAIRVMVETVPPLLGAGVRFGVAGGVMLAVLALHRRSARTRAQLLSALAVGLLLPGANAVVTVAEQEVPSNLAALLIGVDPAVGDPDAPRRRRARLSRQHRRRARRLRRRRAAAAARRAVRGRLAARARRLRGRRRDVGERLVRLAASVAAGRPAGGDRLADAARRAGHHGRRAGRRRGAARSTRGVLRCARWSRSLT